LPRLEEKGVRHGFLRNSLNVFVVSLADVR